MGPSDVTWRNFNKRLDEAMRSNDLYECGVIYYEMADFLKSEGKDAQYIIDKALLVKGQHYKNELGDYQNSGVTTGVEVMANKGACKSCLAQNGKSIAIELALKSSPLPTKGCTGSYGCRCTYLPQI